jgi:hypothetical protein
VASTSRCDSSKSCNIPLLHGRYESAGWEGLQRMRRLGKFPGWAVTAAVFGALWCMLVERLAQYWVIQPEYNFGWLVPILCGYLFWLRWRSRPVSGVPNVGLARYVFWVTALGLLPTWLIVQANPDWSVVAWLLAGQTVILSLCVIYWCGGRAWLRHFAFSTCLYWWRCHGQLF